MKLYKILIKSTILLLLANSALAQSLSVRWGLESAEFYEEIAATEEQNAADMSRRTDNDQIFRYYTIAEPQYGNAVSRLFRRFHEQNWYEKYKQSDMPTSCGFQVAETQHDSCAGREQNDMLTSCSFRFQQYLSGHDPFLVHSFRDLAPRLYFDFAGSSQTQYILTGITVEVLDFSEYSGGGFADNQYAYDIVLLPCPGKYYYAIDRRLRFAGSGRTELTFFSDNFYRSAGLSPMGAYMIDLKFHFLADGTTLEVSTGPFKIDV